MQTHDEEKEIEKKLCAGRRQKKIKKRKKIHRLKTKQYSFF
jgi:hypothetical protein